MITWRMWQAVVTFSEEIEEGTSGIDMPIVADIQYIAASVNPMF